MDSIFIDYDNCLVGRKPIEQDTFYSSQPGGMNERRAVACIKYALEKILCWSPDESVKRFDRYTVSLMKLDKLVQFIDYPVEVTSGDTKYILSLIYPDKVRMTKESMTKDVYAEVLKKEGRQFPREYFSGSKGFFRFCSCLKYLIENYHPVSSTDELYSFMAGRKGSSFLTRYRLKVPAEQFSISLLDVVKYITRDDPDCELYYCYYSFLQAMEKLKKKYISANRAE